MVFVIIVDVVSSVIVLFGFCLEWWVVGISIELIVVILVIFEFEMFENSIIEVIIMMLSLLCICFIVCCSSLIRCIDMLLVFMR